jgi:hypothetical protein
MRSVSIFLVQEPNGRRRPRVRRDFAAFRRRRRRRRRPSYIDAPGLCVQVEAVGQGLHHHHRVRNLFVVLGTPITSTKESKKRLAMHGDIAGRPVVVGSSECWVAWGGAAA